MRVAIVALLALAMPSSANTSAPDPALREFLSATIATSSSFRDRFEAEVWLVDMEARLRPFVSDHQARLRLLKQVHQAAKARDIAPELVLALIEVESGFDRFAISRVGAQGYMQVMPFWKNEIGRPEDNLTDPLTNLHYGCSILQFYLQREKGNLHRALAAYNGSLGRRVYSNKVYRAWHSRWKTGALRW